MSVDDERPDVLLTGLLFYDLVLTGLPGPPVPGEETWTSGMGCGPGGIANLAVAAARFGLHTSLATVFGDDFYGAWCQEVLAGQEGVGLAPSRTAPGWPTPVTVALALPGAPGADRALITHGEEPPYSQDELPGDPPAARTALVHLEAEAPAWLGKAAANGTRVFADVGWDPARRWSRDVLDQLALCHAFLPNEAEATACTRTGTAVAALGALAELVPVAVVTRGDRGAVAVDQTTGECAEVPALDIDVVDASGAGDVFGASFVAASLGGWPLAERLRFAVLAAGPSVARHGGALAAPGWYGVDRWWRARSDPELRRAYGLLADRLPADPGPPPCPAPVTPAGAARTRGLAGARRPRPRPAPDRPAPTASPDPHSDSDSALAAFVFAKFAFPGRRPPFALLMLIFMVPAQLAAVPQFVIMAKLGWIGSMTSLIVPASANAFGILWMRPYMRRAIPDELLDASRIDGARFLRQYWHVVRPGLAFLGIFTSDYGMVMTGALLALVPLLIVFAIGARQIIGDLAKGAVR